jgi:hypothetical protein
MPYKTMYETRFQRIREGFKRRYDAINEISFTYKRLQSILPAVVKRRGAPIAEVLTVQHREDQFIEQGLARVAIEHGQPPMAAVCREASAVVEEIHHAERAASPDGRSAAVVSALVEVRLFLLAAWGRLIDELPGDALPDFRKEAAALQHREAEQHRALLALRFRMENATMGAEQLGNVGA